MFNYRDFHEEWTRDPTPCREKQKMRGKSDLYITCFKKIYRKEGGMRDITVYNDSVHNIRLAIEYYTS